MNRINVTVIFTCFNRKEKSVNCIKKLVELNDTVNFSFIVVDDNSTDGTKDAINSLKLNTNILEGDGTLFWCGGMRKGLDYYLKSNLDEDGFCLLVNDDVDFFEHSIDKMIVQLSNREDTVIVGATCNDQGKFSYGLRRRVKGLKKGMVEAVPPESKEVVGETGNANCVLIPNKILVDVGNMDYTYKHNYGDYDFGFQITRKGYKLVSSLEFIGICNDNPKKGRWMDTSLSRRERLKDKESPKGSPFKEAWHFALKNFGFVKAVRYTISPYIKILLGL